MPGIKYRILTADIRRRPGRPVGGPLSINHQCTDQEKAEAFNAIMAMAINVADVFGQTSELVRISRDIVAPDPAHSALLEACKEVLDVLEITQAKDEVTRGAIAGSVYVLRTAIAKGSAK